jgi:c(7)-type cytochrome triheme protein
MLTTALFADTKPVMKAVIELSAGDKGNVTFPHEKHQKAVKDCMSCHNLFPQKTNAISDLMKQGKLQKKQVMTMCLACHRTMGATGAKTGPTLCSQCHKK